MKNLRSRIAGRQSGFTLVEIAIVLVIIGLLLVGVLQGQEMIENTKTKSIVSDMKAIQAAYNGYLDRYKTLPGDELAATMTNRGWAGAAGAVAADGILAIAPATAFTTGVGEGPAFWRALRASGLLSGDPTAAYPGALPRHGANGMIGVTAATNATPVLGFNTGVFVCASGLSTKQAAAIDVMIDGALPATQIGANVGSLRGVTGAANPLNPGGAAAAVSYSETAQLDPWTVCMRIG